MTILANNLAQTCLMPELSGKSSVSSKQAAANLND